MVSWSLDKDYILQQRLADYGITYDPKTGTVSDWGKGGRFGFDQNHYDTSNWYQTPTTMKSGELAGYYAQGPVNYNQETGTYEAFAGDPSYGGKTAGEYALNKMRQEVSSLGATDALGGSTTLHLLGGVYPNKEAADYYSAQNVGAWDLQNQMQKSNNSSRNAAFDAIKDKKGGLFGGGLGGLMAIGLPLLAMAAPFAFPATMAAIGSGLGATGTILGMSAAPIVGSGLTGALLSGVGSAIQGKPVGQSFLSAGLGGLGGALAGGGSQAITGAAGLTGTAADVAGGALTGAAYGAADDGVEGALQGALMGGIGGGVMGGGGTGESGFVEGGMTELGASGYPMSVPGDMAALTTGAGSTAGGGLSSLLDMGDDMNWTDALKLGSSLYSGYATDQANKKMQDQLNTALSPYTSAGATAAGQLSNALTKGFNYDDYANSDAYNFQLQQGQQALERQLGASGLGQSGAAVKSATDYATNLANQNYGDAYAQWLQKNAQLQGLTGLGSGAASNLGMNSALLTGAGQQNINRLVGNLSENDLVKSMLRGVGSIFA